MGRGRYLVFYLAGGLVAMLAQILADPHSTVPNLGASGAIAAVMGGFIVTYPRDRIKAVLFIFVFVRITFIPAALLIGFWFLTQLVHGMQRDKRAARPDTKDAAIIGCRSTRGPSVEVPIVAEHKRGRIRPIGALRGRAKTMQHFESSRLADLENYSGIVGASHLVAAIKKSVVALHESANRKVSVAKASACVGNELFLAR
jgi:hypothetical protein